ncbi:MAG: PAS domain-containing protein [Proteobacteria bacterium]|nr:PAS domain-containing protein [Desulfobacula sp.]MBU3952617.1 PAS domain-containing protein [Pseudomonadota bacterium]MBU4129312.1 PAS domain-containing protein [Pseudomonadota bacterium]
MGSENQKKIPFHIGIVGGGRACDYFLNLLETTVLPYLDLKILGVCDINPEATGMKKAKKLGIPTFQNFHNFFNDKRLDAIIELTNNKSLPELIAMRPDNVGVLEHNIGRLLRNLFEMNQNLIETKEQAILDRRYYEILFQQTNLGVVVLDLEFNIVDANKVYLNACRKTQKEVIGKKCFQVIKGFYAPCPSENASVECPLMRTLDSGKPSHIIHETILPGNKTKYFSISAYPIKNLEDKVTHVIELWQDITSEITEKWENKVKRIHADMKKVIQEDRLVALGKLVASSVHEINNPIQGLLTFSYIIKDMTKKEQLDKKDLEQLREFNLHMTRELERCGNIVSGLLAFSRETVLEFKNTDINDILEAVISLTRHKLALCDIQLEMSLGTSYPLIVFGDKNQLQQCFLNLIFNAIDAMPQGGKMTINSGIHMDSKKVWIQISDSGTGINDQNLEHIFDPFFTTKEEGGTGLGLSIVYGIVKDHKGEVCVNETSNQGTSFLFTFPGVVSD